MNDTLYQLTSEIVWDSRCEISNIFSTLLLIEPSMTLKGLYIFIT